MIDILLLEDDKLFAESLIDYLEEFGEFNITHTLSSLKFIEYTYSNRYHLYLLDINVEGTNGLDTLKELRDANDNTPTIFLTSYKDKQSLQTAFLNGGDDFLTKPFDMDELILRIHSLLKRSNIQNSVKFDNIELNFSTKTVTVDGKVIKFGYKALELFELFYTHNNQIVTKEMIINKLWSANEQYSEGSIRVYVNSIKKLFEKNNLFHVSSIKSVGYKIEY